MSAAAGGDEDPMIAQTSDGDDEEAGDPRSDEGAVRDNAAGSSDLRKAEYSHDFNKAKGQTIRDIRKAWGEFSKLPHPPGSRRSGVVAFFFPPAGKPTAMTTFPGEDGLAFRKILGLAATSIDSHLNKPEETLKARKNDHSGTRNSCLFGCRSLTRQHSRCAGAG